MRTVGALLVAGWVAAALGAPWLTPHDPAASHRAFAFAPPMPPRLLDERGGVHAPFVYPLRLVSRLEQRYEEDRSRRIPLVFLSSGKLVRLAGEDDAPWFPLGADSFGRDVLSRVAHGARVSLGVALLAVLGSLLVGTLAGGIAAYVGGPIDDGLMRLAEFVLVLPSVYLLLALRAVMPLVLPPSAVFLLMSGILALAGWPFAARGVRAIVAAERQRDYAAAAVAAGASHARVLLVHLLPAARGFLATQAVLLVPAFVLAEATLSFVGFGFPDSVPSWGTMLQEAADVGVLADFPWCLAPAGAIFTVALGLNLVAQASGGAWRPPGPGSD